MSKFLVIYYSEFCNKDYVMKTFTNYPSPFQLEKWISKDHVSKGLFKVKGYTTKDCCQMLYEHGHLPNDKEGNYWCIKEGK